MDSFVIQGGTPLQGEVAISGSKNAVLPIITATLLAPGKYKIENIPRLRDVRTIAHLMRIVGAKIQFKERHLIIDTTHADFPEAPYELVKTMRASFYVLGPMLARFGRARVSLPGGCAWGPRPVDLHISGMEQLGASVEITQGYINATASRLKGAVIELPIPSVGATGNILMAAVMGEGITTIQNAAMEPEIINLGDFLNAMGSKIDGLGSSVITIEGVRELKPVDFKVIPDRIEAGTFLAAGFITKGDVTLRNCNPEHLRTVLAKFVEAGANVQINKDSIRLQGGERIIASDLMTEVYPGYPTDMQAQWVALMALSDGESTVTDSIYADRFAHVPELCRLGADISCKGNRAYIRGVNKLVGAPVMSTDLRASASLVIAALASEGTSEVQRIYHIDRGYERIETKLRKLGARIERVVEGLDYYVGD